MWMDSRTFQNEPSNRTLNATAASLLGFLLEGPMTGWDIVASVEASIGYFWNLTRSQVYRELRSLAETGYVEVGKTEARERRPYSITEAGREAFYSWLHEDPGDDLIRMQALLKFFFGDQLDPETLERFVTLQRLEHKKRLGYFRQILPELEVTHPMCAHTLKFGIRYEEAMLDWLDSFPSRIPAAISNRQNQDKSVKR
jgi:DNA-binding PadR family transcriptional regulator